MKAAAISLALATATATAPAKPPTYKTYTADVTARCVGAGCSSRQASKGVNVYSAKQNKTAWLPSKNGGQGIPTVVDFNAKAAFFLSGPPSQPCTYYCPLDDDDTICNSQTNMNIFCGYDYINKIKYIDSTTEGDHYHINSGIGPITLAQWDIYMNESTHYPEETYFGPQPFGKVIGNISTHYDTFSTAEPDASLFDVGDTKYCQQGDDSQCSDVTIRAALSGIKLIVNQ